MATNNFRPSLTLAEANTIRDGLLARQRELEAAGKALRLAAHESGQKLDVSEGSPYQLGAAEYGRIENLLRMHF